MSTVYQNQQCNTEMHSGMCEHISYDQVRWDCDYDRNEQTSPDREGSDQPLCCKVQPRDAASIMANFVVSRKCRSAALLSGLEHYACWCGVLCTAVHCCVCLDNGSTAGNMGASQGTNAKQGEPWKTATRHPCRCRCICHSSFFCASFLSFVMCMHVVALALRHPWRSSDVAGDVVRPITLGRCYW